MNLQQLSSFHYTHNADCTLSLKELNQFDRYGVVELNTENKVTDFKEKKYYEKGLINGGVYVLNVTAF